METTHGQLRSTSCRVLWDVVGQCSLREDCWELRSRIHRFPSKCKSSIVNTILRQRVIRSTCAFEHLNTSTVDCVREGSRFLSRLCMGASGAAVHAVPRLSEFRYSNELTTIQNISVAPSWSCTLLSVLFFVVLCWNCCSLFTYRPSLTLF